MHVSHCIAIALAAAIASPAAADPPRGEIGYPPKSLGYDALVAADYATAELQLRADFGLDEHDPARLINLGQVLARTGRTEQAAELFRRAIDAEEIEFELADGRVMRSRDAARRALRSLKAAHASR